jgi:hypothetical protein
MIQQAHAALMRDVAGDPTVIQVIRSGLIQHGAIATSRRALSR